MTGGKRDFVSRQQIQAARYDVLCEQAVIGEAKKILGLGGGWPPEPTATAPVTSPTDDVVEKVADTVADIKDGNGFPPATA
jgi:hypothetical protein